jgi:PhnB protein
MTIQKINPYLFFNGTCERAMTFYAKVLGGEIEMLMRYSDAPEGEAPAGLGNLVMHASVKIGDMRILASDSPPDRYNKPHGFDISLHIADLAEAEKVFAALSDKGTVNMPFGKTFWARGFGGCVDQFGVPWMVNCE